MHSVGPLVLRTLPGSARTTTTRSPTTAPHSAAAIPTGSGSQPASPRPVFPQIVAVRYLRLSAPFGWRTRVDPDPSCALRLGRLGLRGLSVGASGPAWPVGWGVWACVACRLGRLGLRGLSAGELGLRSDASTSGELPA